MDPLARLGRKDKWFLGGGKGAIYAPPFPRHLLAPGFWDECYFADIRIPRLFTAFVLNDQDRPIRFESYHKGWRPDRLTIMHYAGDVVIRERRCVTENNAWTSELELVTSVRPLQVVISAMVDIRPWQFAVPWQSGDGLEINDEDIAWQWQTAWPTAIEPDRTGIDAERPVGSGEMGPVLPLYFCLGSSHSRQSFCAQITERQDESPRWETSILPQKFVGGRLPNTVQIEDRLSSSDALVHIAQHFVLEDRRPIVLACGSGLSPMEARNSLRDAVEDEPMQRSATKWRAYFSNVPQFESSDPFLTNAYWNRWYGLRLNTVDLANFANFAPFVTEGVGFFRNFVTYSSQAHLRELSWMHDPSLALGIVENLRRVQRPDGSFPGHNYSVRPSRDFYHADFATGCHQLEQLHGIQIDKSFLQRYFDFLRVDRGYDKHGLVQVFDQNETGQEYMSRYTEISQDGDQWEAFSLGGVDATTYFLLLAKYLNAGISCEEFVKRSFDPESQFFCDVVPGSNQRSNARPATGFYALLLAPNPSVARRWIANADEFWLPFGFPATAKSDPTFNPIGEWKGKRLNCPWNGRSWPMTNCAIVDTLANVAIHDSGLAKLAGEALMKVVKLMFHDGDPNRPTSFEHYDPVTGVPSLYRGYDDYMHSWIVDLILRHAVGIVPGETEKRPLPLPVDWIRCESTFE